MAYDPKKESSRATEQYRSKGAEGVVLKRGPGLCLCGCEERPEGKTSQFRMGHDARYRGILIRAHLNDTRITLVDTGGNGITGIHTAAELAVVQGWEGYLQEAEKRLTEKKTKASRAVVAKATGPQVGDEKLIKVGRWEYTGEVAAVYDGGDRVVYDYVDKKGNRKQHTVLKQAS